jgi:hypothetical protein
MIVCSSLLVCGVAEETEILAGFRVRNSLEQLLNVILLDIVERREHASTLAGLAYAGSVAEQAWRHIRSQKIQ